eukprot:jgi/Botrbrau1/2490/Bobra.0226s0047.1
MCMLLWQCFWGVLAPPRTRSHIDTCIDAHEETRESGLPLGICGFGTETSATHLPAGVPGPDGDVWRCFGKSTAVIGLQGPCPLMYKEALPAIYGALLFLHPSWGRVPHMCRRNLARYLQGVPVERLDRQFSPVDSGVLLEERHAVVLRKKFIFQLFTDWDASNTSVDDQTIAERRRGNHYMQQLCSKLLPFNLNLFKQHDTIWSAWEEGRDLHIDIVRSSLLPAANLQQSVPGQTAARSAQDKSRELCPKTSKPAKLFCRRINNHVVAGLPNLIIKTMGGLHADAGLVEETPGAFEPGRHCPRRCGGIPGHCAGCIPPSEAAIPGAEEPCDRESEYPFERSSSKYANKDHCISDVQTLALTNLNVNPGLTVLVATSS